MNNHIKLLIIKIVHSLIWIFMVAVIFYVLYCGVFDAVNHLTWISIGIIIVEGIVILAFGMTCPLTVLARKYSDSTEDNFDIYLPNVIARYNKQIFSVIYLIGFFTVLYRVI